MNIPGPGTQQLPDIDAIKELGADLVLMTAQPTDAVALELQQANIDFVVIPPASDLEGVRQNYVDLFRLLYGEETGAKMAEEYLVPFDHKLAEIQSCLDACRREEHLHCLCSRRPFADRHRRQF